MEVMNWMESLHPESPIREYLRWMNQSGNDPLYKEKYEQIVREQKEQGKIFLTVVLRTQGKRMEMLQDVLTCLQAQSDTDFETVIICHRTSGEACEAVRSLVAVQTPEFDAGDSKRRGRAGCAPESRICLREGQVRGLSGRR